MVSKSEQSNHIFISAGSDWLPLNHHHAMLRRQASSSNEDVKLSSPDENSQSLLLPEFSRTIAVTALACHEMRRTSCTVNSVLSKQKGVITHGSDCSRLKNNRPSVVRQLRNQLRDELQAELEAGNTTTQAKPHQIGSSPVSVVQCPAHLLAEAEISMLAIDGDDSDQHRTSDENRAKDSCVKRVTFAAELNLRRRSSRQLLLGVSVDEIDALPCEPKKHKPPQELVSILRKKLLTKSQLLAKIDSVKTQIAQETLEKQHNEEILNELMESITSLRSRLQDGSSQTGASPAKMLRVSLDEVEKRGRKYTRKISNLRKATELARLESRKLKSQLVDIFAPLKKIR